MQNLTIIGHLGADATVSTVGDSQVIEGRVAVNSSYKKQDGTTVENTSWYRMKFWKRNGASTKVADYLKKGTSVAITGTPSVEAYKTKEGEAAATMVITVRELQLLNSTKEAGSNDAGMVSQQVAAGSVSDDDNDLPF